jgi:endoglucanase
MRFRFFPLMSLCAVAAIFAVTDSLMSECSGGDAFAQPSDAPAFTPRKGVGGIRTFSQPRPQPGSPERYDKDPYTPRWSTAMPARRLNEIQSAGFDFLRINIDPGPLFDSDDESLRQRLSELKQAIDASLAAGLGVVLDVHFSQSHPLWNFRLVTAGFETVAFKRYVQTLQALGELISRYDPKRVALEVFNEPPPPCDWRDRPDWPAQLQVIFATARQAAPRHTLFVAGSCWASGEGLLRLDGSKFDRNTIFVFHDYSPFVFTHQGYWASSKYLEYLPPVPYPPDAIQQPETLDRVQNRIRDASNIPNAERDRELKAAEKYLVDYFQNWKGRASIEHDFGAVRSWSEKYGIGSDRIILGEFGAMKDVWGKKGANPADRARWLSDMRTTAEEFGFRWAVWSLTNTMGIIQGDVDGPLDPTILKALGLRPNSN